ncbi:MAG: sigma-70 family RNA polymerase sigma factor [Phycisphaerales bacterium]|nr:sigma-70 family RNA polymerase sigma factor [Phycisphaerales bacterium]MDG2132508.1 sigma-70 family RNA polymerase sigma factor [Phycisphaerales bacterium]
MSDLEFESNHSDPRDPPSAEEVFEVLMRQNAGHLMAFIRAMVRNNALAEDVFQETFMVAWRRFEDFDRDRPFGPWLRGIAHRTALGLMRKTRKEFAVDTAIVDVLESHAAGYERISMSEESGVLEMLNDCVGRLPDRYREVIEVLYRGKRSIAEVAEATDAGAEAVKKRLQRARRMIADCLRMKGLLA